MPIRKRITDLDGYEYKEFQKRRREGAPPEAPRKPKAEQRADIMAAINLVPVGQRMPLRTWSDRYQIMFLTKVYPLWGVDLALYPSCTNADTHGTVLCTGLFVSQLTTTRKGVRPKLILKDEALYWYGKIIDWIGENNYGL